MLARLAGNTAGVGTDRYTPGMASSGIGQRIAVYRRRRGLSQSALAGLVGRSESWLSQVERGVRSVDKMSVLLDLAKVLHVDVQALTGRPWELSPNGGPMVQGVDAIRSVLTNYGHMVGSGCTETVSLSDFRQAVASMHRWYQAAQYDAVIRDMPDLLGRADMLRFGIQGADEREVSLAYASAYVVGSKLLTKLGVSDLAAVTADRAAMTAGGIDSPAAHGMAIYQVVCALLRSDRNSEAEDLAVRMAETLQPHVRSDDPALVSVTGALWLIAAVSAARRTDRDEAWRRLDLAQGLAELLGTDANYAWTAFGPTNVAIHRVSVAAELGDPGSALDAAADVDVNRLPEELRSRRAQNNLDLAWAQAQRKRDAEATLHLLEAERVAPEALKFNVIAREMIREMLTRGKRATSGSLSALATRAGVLE